LTVASAQHAFERFGRASVDFLVRHIRRHIDEVARPRFRGELQVLAPAHARAALHHVDHALEVAVVMRTGLRIRMDVDGARPQLARPDAREIDRSLAVHARRLRRVRIELVAGDDAHAVMLPARVGKIVGMVGHVFQSTAAYTRCRNRLRKKIRWFGACVISRAKMSSAGSTKKEVPPMPLQKYCPRDPGCGPIPASLRTAKPRPKP